MWALSLTTLFYKVPLSVATLHFFFFVFFVSRPLAFLIVLLFYVVFFYALSTITLLLVMHFTLCDYADYNYCTLFVYFFWPIFVFYFFCTCSCGCGCFCYNILFVHADCVIAPTTAVLLLLLTPFSIALPVSSANKKR